VSTEKPETGPWGRKFWNGVAILTAIGLIGPVIIFLKLWPDIQKGFMPACAIDAVYGVFTVAGVALALLGGLAGLGLLMFRLQSPWGALVLIICNLVMMGFYGLDNPVAPGELFWATVVVLIAAAPAIAGTLVLWPLSIRWQLWVRAVEFVIIALIALPVAWLYGYGVTNDIRTAFTSPSPSAAYLFIAHQRPPAGCAGEPGSL
jgi:hypothetical protein